MTAKQPTKQPSTNQATTKNRWLIRLVMVLVIAAIVAAGFVYSQLQTFLTQPISQHNTPIHLTVEQGSSVYKVAHQLQAQGFMTQPKWFAWYVRYLQKQNAIQAGEFEIQPHWTVDELINGLVNAKNVQYPVTFVAGHTIEQTLQMLQGLPKIKKTLDIADVKSLQKIFGVDKKISSTYPYATIEGLVLPETYHYQAGDTDKQILLRAHQALTKVLDQAWQNKDKNLPYKKAYEVLIMASIVEKETGYSPERPLIAGVFLRRLNIGMRLQTDPTVIYGIGQKYDGNIRKRDLLKKTPYNTYTINGLPPTPIALASAEAINAVVHPQATKALYFVAKGGGQHYFSNTLKEHNRAVQKYLLGK